MNKLNTTEMRTVNGGWYFGNVYCPICGKKGNPTVVQRIAYSKSVLQNMMIATHGMNAWGAKIKH